MKVHQITHQNIINHNYNKNQRPERTVNKDITSLYSTTCPVGANYFNPSFGLNNPQASLARAKNLQKDYAQKGLNYFLPDKVWSTKDIMKAVNKAIAGFDNLVKQQDISAQSLNKLVADLLPKEISEKIEVKDMLNDYPKFLKDLGYSEKQIDSELKYCAGVSAQNKDKTLIFVPLHNVQYMPYNQVSSKKTFAHELKHALTSNTTNIEKSDLYKLNNPNLKEDIYKMFHILERTYRIDDGVYFSPTELTDENFIKNIKNMQTNKSFNSTDELSKDMKKTVDEIFKTEQNLEKADKKNVYEFLQHLSKDEREAYSTSKVMRECAFFKDMPLGIELNTLKYKFFEKFFKQQANS